jgi:hypothetical protein
VEVTGDFMMQGALNYQGGQKNALKYPARYMKHRKKKFIEVGATAAKALNELIGICRKQRTLETGLDETKIIINRK